MAEKDYTKDSKKWPKTPGKDWQLKNGDVQTAFNKGWGESKKPKKKSAGQKAMENKLKDPRAR